MPPPAAPVIDEVLKDPAQLIAICELPDHLPRRRGKKFSRMTLWRWIVRGRNGRRLRTIQIGGHKFTSLKWLSEFISGADGTNERHEPCLPASDFEAAERELNRLGIG